MSESVETLLIDNSALLTTANKVLKALIPQGSDPGNFAGESIDTLTSSDTTIASIDRLGFSPEKIPDSIKGHPLYHVLAVRAAVNAFIFAQEPELGRQLLMSIKPANGLSLGKTIDGIFNGGFNSQIELNLTQPSALPKP